MKNENMNIEKNKFRRKLSSTATVIFTIIFVTISALAVLIGIKLVKNYMFIKATGLDKMIEQQKNFEDGKYLSEIDEKLKIYDDTER